MKQFIICLLGVILLYPTSLVAQSAHSSKARAFLGIDKDCSSKSKAKKLGFENYYGSYVAYVYKNSAAEKMGLRPFDYVVGINGEEASSDKSLSTILCQYKIADKVKVHFYRNGLLKIADAVLGACGTKHDHNDTEENRAFLGVNGVEEVDQLGGVRVRIEDLSTAARIQMRDDDIIVQINDFPILNWMDVHLAISQLAPGDRVKVKCKRKSKIITCSGFIDSYARTKQRRKLDEARQEILLPNGTDYEQYLDEALSEVAREKLPVLSEEELGEYIVPQIKIKKANSNELAAKLDRNGVNDLKVEKLNLFPHEERGLFELTFLLFDRGDTSVKLFNKMGEEVYRFDLENFEGTFRDEVDLSNTPYGTYFLSLSQNEKSLNKKIILE